jgi:hypothetical protein
VASVETPTHTPAVVVEWEQTVGGAIYLMSLEGGTYAYGDPIEEPATPASRRMLGGASAHLTQPDSPMTFQFGVSYHHPTTIGAPQRCGHASEGPGIGYAVPLAGNLVVSGDFEEGPGSAGWTQQSPHEMIRRGNPHRGEYAAIFPLWHDSNVSIAQRILLPADAMDATLTYWWGVVAEETSHPHDHMRCLLVDSQGAVVRELDARSDADATGYWQQARHDLSAFAGREVWLRFEATSDSQDLTNFLIDDVAILYRDDNPPAVTHVAAPNTIRAGQAAEFQITFDGPMNSATRPQVMVVPQTGGLAYCLTSKTGAAYVNGYLTGDLTQWHGRLDPGIAPCAGIQIAPMGLLPGTYTVHVLGAQDAWGHVMAPACDVHTLTVIDAPTFNVSLPIVLRR